MSVAEYTAKMKEMHGTVEIEYNLWDRARKSPDKYAEPLAIEIKSKATAAKRRLAADLYGDGTGVLGQITTASTQLAFSSGKLVVTLDNLDASVGGVGFFEYGDKVHFYSSAGVVHDGVEDAANVATDYFIVVDKNRANNTVTLAGYDSAADTLLTLVNNDGDTGTSVADGDYIMRMGQTTKNISSISDYNLITEAFAGLESLAASDGRTVHGITMSGANAGSAYDCSAAQIDVSHIQAAMSQMKARVGSGYSWPMMVMAPETNDALVESREVDRRFTTITDNKRGVNKFVYVHESDNLEVYSSEFCPKKRIWLMPQQRNGDKVLEFHGSDFEAVKPNGQGSEFFLKPGSSGGHEKTIVSYVQAYICLICKQPGTIMKIHNFTA